MRRQLVFKPDKTSSLGYPNFSLTTFHQTRTGNQSPGICFTILGDRLNLISCIFGDSTSRITEEKPLSVPSVLSVVLMDFQRLSSNHGTIPSASGTSALRGLATGPETAAVPRERPSRCAGLQPRKIGSVFVLSRPDDYLKQEVYHDQERKALYPPG